MTIYHNISLQLELYRLLINTLVLSNGKRTHECLVLSINISINILPKQMDLNQLNFHLINKYTHKLLYIARCIKIIHKCSNYFIESRRGLLIK